MQVSGLRKITKVKIYPSGLTQWIFFIIMTPTVSCCELCTGLVEDEISKNVS